MATPKYNTYVGMRYVPIFDGEWDSTKTYEPLVIVSNQGNSYTSRTFVPTGINITNTEYWALTGNYNAQVEYYRQETARVLNIIDDCSTIYDCVADMVADENLSNVEYCTTLGYYAPYDGGGRVYHIVDELPTGYFININNLLYAIPMIEDFVTPEMYGAYGDGTHDDTAYIQYALNSGTNVKFINTKKYKITDTLTIENITRKGKVIYSDAFETHRTNSIFNIYFETVKPVFVVKTDGITFKHLTIDGTNLTTELTELTFITTNIEAVDVDMTISECALYHFYIIASVIGRGLRFVDNVVGSCSSIADIGWKYESDEPWHDDATGMRGYIFENNRLHSISQRDLPIINIQSGNAYGLIFSNNVVDRGYSSLILAYENVDNIRITNNIFNGASGRSTSYYFCQFLGNVNQLTFSDNNITSMIDTDKVNTYIYIAGTANQLEITNNNVNKMFNGNFIECHANVSNSNISNNIIGELVEATTNRGILLMAVANLTISKSTFMGNIIGAIISSNATQRYAGIVRCGDACTLDTVKANGNIVPHYQSSEMLIAVPTYTNCTFDFTT